MVNDVALFVFSLFDTGALLFLTVYVVSFHLPVHVSVCHGFGKPARSAVAGELTVGNFWSFGGGSLFH